MIKKYSQKLTLDVLLNFNRNITISFDDNNHPLMN